MKPVVQVFAGDFAAKVLLGLAGLALIRFMPPGEFADLTLATVVSALVIQGLTGNLNRVYIVGHRRLGLHASPQLFLALQLWLIAVLAVAFAPVAAALGRLYWLVVAVTLAHCLLEFVKTFFQQELRFASFALIELARTLAFIVALAVLIPLAGGGLRAWHVLSLQAVCAAAAVLPVLKGKLGFGALFRLREMAETVRLIAGSRYLYMVGYFLGVALLLRIDVLMLEILDTRLELATYGASFRYYSILTMLLAAVHTVFLPLTQRLGGREELRELFVRHERMLTVIVPVVLTGAWASGWIIPLIDGGRYPGAVTVFRVLSLSAIVSLVCSPHANLLLRYGAFRYMFALCGGGILLNVALNILLIPRYHATGAAWATLAAAGLVNSMIYVRSRRLLASRPLPEAAPTVPAGPHAPQPSVAAVDHVNAA